MQLKCTPETKAKRVSEQYQGNQENICPENFEFSTLCTRFTGENFLENFPVIKIHCSVSLISTLITKSLWKKLMKLSRKCCPIGPVYTGFTSSTQNTWRFTGTPEIIFFFHVSNFFFFQDSNTDWRRKLC
jgi:hypothetical protein